MKTSTVLSLVRRLTAVLLALLLIGALLPLGAVVHADTNDNADGDFLYTLNEDGASVAVSGYTGESTEVVIPDTLGGLPVTAIAARAFDGLYTLTSITLPASLTTIGAQAFRSCAGITTIDIPSGVTTIGDSAFYNCLKLTDITLGNQTYQVGYYAFHNTAWFNTHPTGCVYLGRILYAYKGVMEANTTIRVPFGTAAIAPSAFSGYADLTAVELPVGLKSIGAWAFMGCTNLVKLRLPKTVESIGVAAFDDCLSLSFHGASDSFVQRYAAENNIDFVRDQTLELSAGDLNGDGILNTTDVRLLLWEINGEPDLYDDRLASCDFSDDGVLDSTDARLMLSCIF